MTVRLANEKQFFRNVSSAVLCVSIAVALQEQPLVLCVYPIHIKLRMQIYEKLAPDSEWSRVKNFVTNLEYGCNACSSNIEKNLYTYLNKCSRTQFCRDGNMLIIKYLCDVSGVQYQITVILLRNHHLTLCYFDSVYATHLFRTCALCLYRINCYC